MKYLHGMDLKRNKVVGEVLASVRRECGFTQTELADLMGYTQSTVSKTEAGQRQLTLVETFMICDMIGADPSAFMRRAYITLSERHLLPTDGGEDADLPSQPS